MTLPVIEATIKNVIDSGLIGECMSIAWHAGEPLTVGPRFYEAAFERIDAVVAGRYPVHHSIQTNAMLIDQHWCDLFSEHGVQVGVSVDGPAFIHDHHRKTRDGKGTHARAMRGVGCLLKNRIAFHAIAVLTASSLPYPDEIFEFFLEEGFSEVGFNIDEREGERCHSTIGPQEEPVLYRFLERIQQLSAATGNRLRIRELDEARKVLLRGCSAVEIDGVRYPRNAQVLPLEVVSVDHGGNFSTFSPELLGQARPEYNDFVFGNVVEDSLGAVFSNPHFVETYRQVIEGVDKCRLQCEYFELCGGGAPANKLYENGSFSSTDTAYCRNVIMAPLSLALAELEKRLQV